MLIEHIGSSSGVECIRLFPEREHMTLRPSYSQVAAWQWRLHPPMYDDPEYDVHWYQCALVEL